MKKALTRYYRGFYTRRSAKLSNVKKRKGKKKNELKKIKQEDMTKLKTENMN